MREKLLGMHIVKRIHMEDHERAEETLKNIVDQAGKRAEMEEENGIGNVSKALKASVINLE
jgi:hypothetical protein